MKQANFISLRDSGYGVDEFTIGSGGQFVNSREEMYANTSLPMCWAGFFKPQWVEICKNNNLTFFNFDSAYFGNKKTKIIFRLSVNEFQNTQNIINRPADRWGNLNIKIDSFKQGKEIIIVPPDRKICHTLGLGTIDEWLNTTILEIKNHTDRPIKVRIRPDSRTERTTVNTFKDFIKDNTYCVVGHASNALVEAAMCDIPVISLGQSATKSLYNSKISDIENLQPADNLHKLSWLYHLSYCQFTRDELLSGYAWKIISNQPANLGA